MWEAFVTEMLTKDPFTNSENSIEQGIEYLQVTCVTPSYTVLETAYKHGKKRDENI